MINLTFYAVPSFFRHQKDSGSWSIHKGENFFNESFILVLKTLQYSNYNLWSMFCLFPVFCLLGRHLYSSTTSLRCGLGLVSKVCCTHQSPLTSTVKMEVMWAKTARSYAQATVFYTPGKM